MEYITELIAEINQRHHCAALHRGTIPSREVLGVATDWTDSVEVFALGNHPTAQRAFAWGWPREEHESAREIQVILEIPEAEA